MPSGPARHVIDRLKIEDQAKTGDIDKAVITAFQDLAENGIVEQWVEKRDQPPHWA